MRVRLGHHAAVLAATIVVLTGCGDSRSQSWQYGYDNADPAVQMVTLGVDADSACRSVPEIGKPEGDLNRTEVLQGCLAALADAAG